MQHAVLYSVATENQLTTKSHLLKLATLLICDRTCFPSNAQSQTTPFLTLFQRWLRVPERIQCRLCVLPGTALAYPTDSLRLSSDVVIHHRPRSVDTTTPLVSGNPSANSRWQAWHSGKRPCLTLMVKCALCSILIQNKHRLLWSSLALRDGWKVLTARFFKGQITSPVTYRRNNDTILSLRNLRHSHTPKDRGTSKFRESFYTVGLLRGQLWALITLMSCFFVFCILFVFRIRFALCFSLFNPALIL